jgi:pimeloyl-ACP methyl ester carboxylesterase
VREDYLTSYAGDGFVESMAYVRSYPSDLPVLAERLGDIRTPVQIIAGRHDALVPPSNAEFLHARLADVVAAAPACAVPETTAVLEIAAISPTAVVPDAMPFIRRSKDCEPVTAVVPVRVFASV